MVFFFFVIVIALGWLFGTLLEYGNAGIIIAALIAVVMALIGFFSGDQVALTIAGAQPMTKEQSPYVYRIVENLAITAGMPMPRIYLIPDNGMNAFATGRDPQHASIAFTTGIVEKLENEELEAVAAHELSHIKNYDTRLLMLVLILAGFVAILSDVFLRHMWHNRTWGKATYNPAGPLWLIGIIFAIFTPLVAQLIKLAISRRREFLADADGALLTRFPEGLANALKKIAANNRPLLRTNTATAHLYLVNPFGSSKIAKLFSTHPPIEERIKALEQMAGKGSV